MDIIGYNKDTLKEETKSQLNILSEQYHRYKKPYRFPTRFRGKYMVVFSSIIQFILDYRFRSELYYIHIYFDFPKYDRITKDSAAKFVDKLSAIGGTMGLLTGFSLISLAEIVYFSAKIFLGFLKKRFT